MTGKSIKFLFGEGVKVGSVTYFWVLKAIIYAGILKLVATHTGFRS